MEFNLMGTLGNGVEMCLSIIHLVTVPRHFTGKFSHGRLLLSSLSALSLHLSAGREQSDFGEIPQIEETEVQADEAG